MLRSQQALRALRSAASSLRLSQLPRATAVCARGFADDSHLKKTVLYDTHVAAGGKMVDFAGWSMPIQYKDSIMESTKHCRSSASLFDVSHMCGLSLKGKDAIAYLEQLVVGDVKALKDGTGTLSVLTNEKGGIIDDTVITKVNDEHVYLVVNAGCREKDLAHMGKYLEAAQKEGKDVKWEIHDDRSLLALQGPKAMDVLQKLTSFDLSKLYFGMFDNFDVNGVPCWVTRTGYTGEDGFEISIPHDGTQKVADVLLSDSAVRICGLGARDSLRLEAGLCLYGNDLTEDITPIEAGLTWTIAKSRREACDFLGGDVIKQQLKDGIATRRVGFVIPKGAPARQHSKILDMEGAEIGEISSGGFSPCLQKNIAMGYVLKKHAKAGTEVQMSVRGKTNGATVTKMPFVTCHYYRPS